MFARHNIYSHCNLNIHQEITAYFTGFKFSVPRLLRPGSRIAIHWQFCYFTVSSNHSCTKGEAPPQQYSTVYSDNDLDRATAIQASLNIQAYPQILLRYYCIFIVMFNGFSFTHAVLPPIFPHCILTPWRLWMLYIFASPHF